ncbi:MAG TPA: phosphoribosylformylglycinamidine synthase subunit PurQ [Candidatus Saccharimonadales bacterium]|nr:phosphoribosylformylglycinamidine synthase subunit PurQ [Candidatus Saccharimonadales bacterium]
MKPRVALLRFPGVNCEFETARALACAGAEVTWLGWGARLEEAAFDGFVLPGGFSYEDRVRAGAVASRSEWMDALGRAGEAGKPVLGICNGAQVLVEGGLVPGRAGLAVELALARNRGRGAGGYLCCWCFVEIASMPGWPGRLAGTRWPVPVAHAEGRFVSRDPAVRAELESGRLGAARYVQPDGAPAAGSPWDPNGSLGAAAGVGSERGNVLAFMPHPERAAWLRQVPEGLPGEWGERRRGARTAAELMSPGPGQALLDAFVHAAREAVR